MTSPYDDDAGFTTPHRAAEEMMSIPDFTGTENRASALSVIAQSWSDRLSQFHMVSKMLSA
jgi:hypothetical protein